MRTFVEHLVAAARRRLVPFVLSYHGLGDEVPEDDPHGLMTSVDRFDEHLDLLLGLGYRLVGIDELWRAAAHGRRAADGLGAITFDDGLAETSVRAAHLGATRDVTFSMFVSPGLLGQDHPDLPPGRRIIRGDELRALDRSGLVVGAHTHSHVDLTALSPEAQLEELVRSRGELEALLGGPVRTMAYPYGRYDATTQRMAARAGFEIACANDGAGPWRALALPREAIYPSASGRRVRLKAAGLYGPATNLARVRGRLRR